MSIQNTKYPRLYDAKIIIVIVSDSAVHTLFLTVKANITSVLGWVSNAVSVCSCAARFRGVSSVCEQQNGPNNYKKPIRPDIFFRSIICMFNSNDDYFQWKFRSRKIIFDKTYLCKKICLRWKAQICNIIFQLPIGKKLGHFETGTSFRYRE